MTVLITKQNVPFFMELTGLKESQFKSETKNTCTFRLSQERFEELYRRVSRFDNPYALMSW